MRCAGGVVGEEVLAELWACVCGTCLYEGSAARGACRARGVPARLSGMEIPVKIAEGVGDSERKKAHVVGEPTNSVGRRDYCAGWMRSG